MNLFPIVEGLPTKMTSGIMYALCSDGIYECRRLPGGGMVSTKVDGIKGLPVGRSEIRFLSKKIPISIYWEIVRFFRTVEEHNKTNLEAYVEVGYNPKDESYFLYVPEQLVGPASVKYEINDFTRDNPGCWIVANAHSHPHFTAKFSGTDDANDVRDQFSLVIGHIEKAIPDVEIRFSAGSKHIKMGMEDLFSAEECGYVLDMKAAVKRVNCMRRIDGPTVCTGPNVSTGYNPYEQMMPRTRNIDEYNSWVNNGNSIYSNKTSIYDMVKSCNEKGFTISELMGEGW